MNDEDAASGATQIDDGQLFSDLVSALAVGARAVSGLPLGDDFEYQSSFPEVRQMLSESKEGLVETLLLALEGYASTENNVTNIANILDGTHLDDPVLWETCADACDALLEQVEAHLRTQDSGGGSRGSVSTAGNSSSLSQLSDTARQQAAKSFGRLLAGIVEMEKPQDIHGLFLDNGAANNAANAVTIGKMNDRQTPFIPKIAEKHNAVAPLDLSMHSGHGLESRFGTLRSTKIALPPNIVAPAHHVKHPYEIEIQSFEYTYEQLEIPTNKPPPIEVVETLQARWVDTLEGLRELETMLTTSESVTEIAFDLEAHSYRTFAGLTCLIQLSFVDNCGEIQNFLIDPFPLWNQFSATLGPILSNPRIVKIFHGADSDVQWLQRDFGLYVVNLFDTGRAARALQFSLAGYAYLLKHYAGITPDKSQQLSDWRQRPLPEAMKQYAIMDTHYLISIYTHLKYDLAQRQKKLKDAPSLRDVLNTSRNVSLIRYAPEPFRPDGYKSLISTSSSKTQRRKVRGGSRGYKTELNETQESVLRLLYDWRDATARAHDESIQYVCSNQAMVRLALSCPTTLTALQGLLNPMPPLVLRSSKEILGIIQGAKRSEEVSAGPTMMTPSTKTKSSPVGAPSSAFFKPAKSQEDEQPPVRRTEDRLLSPVLGTEALYMQAGWITPQNGDGPDAEVVDVVTTTTDDDVEDGSDLPDGCSLKPRHGLSVHKANQSYRSNQFTPHSLQLGGRGGQSLVEGDNPHSISERANADGLGPARVAREHSQSPTATTSIEEDVELAKKTASLIRTNMSQEEQQLLGLISVDAEMDDDDDERDAVEGRDERGDGPNGKGLGSDESDFVIPRSMREIYRISNRNRRNKKVSSPSPNERGSLANEKELEALAKAEEILKARGLEGRNYFDEFPPDGPKRQRTKSTGASSTSSEEAQGHDSGSVSREDDIALMKDIGWIKDGEEVTSMLNQGRASAEEDEAQVDPAVDEDSEEEDATGGGKPTKQPFDYSSTASIGAFNPTAPPPANPFFAGAATTGGPLNQQLSGKSEKKKQNSGGRNKQSRRQAERPEKRDGRSQAYKKR